MKRPILVAVVFLVLICPMSAQIFDLPESPQSKFWTKERIAVTLGLSAEAAYDGVSTQYLEHHGSVELDPLAKPLVDRGTAGQVAASMLGVGTVVGLQYAAHKLHHDKIADWIGRIALTGEGINCTRQHSLVKSVAGKF